MTRFYFLSKELHSIVFVGALLATCFMPVSFLSYSATLKMEAICSSETSVEFQRTTQRYIPEERTFRPESSQENAGVLPHVVDHSGLAD
jgi:hypothetical protein